MEFFWKVNGILYFEKSTLYFVVFYCFEYLEKGEVMIRVEFFNIIFL